MTARRVLAIVVAVAVVGFGVYWFFGREGNVVAIVNGQEIARAELNLRVTEVSKQYETYGIALTKDDLVGIKQDALDQLVVEMLLLQAASAAGISISDEDIEAQYDIILSSHQSEEQFAALLREYGYTPKSFKARLADQMAIQLLIDRHISENVSTDELSVTDAEIRERFEFYTDGMAEPPAFEDVYEYIKEEILDEKMHDLMIVETLIANLKAAADIKIP